MQIVEQGRSVSLKPKLRRLDVHGEGQHWNKLCQFQVTYFSELFWNFGWLQCCKPLRAIPPFKTVAKDIWGFSLSSAHLPGKSGGSDRTEAKLGVKNTQLGAAWSNLLFTYKSWVTKYLIFLNFDLTSNVISSEILFSL